ncbi:hypothetical protein M2132_001681 [Dysgonomonas sp. PH5-45]|nr:hypothetical protein [Dysgonomonas sp. PH5-45]MDH6388238.1 hypothetical protein [Dysgonomonas sp. PH5-37]
MLLRSYKLRVMDGGLVVKMSKKEGRLSVKVCRYLPVVHLRRSTLFVVYTKLFWVHILEKCIQRIFSCTYKAQRFPKFYRIYYLCGHI